MEIMEIVRDCPFCRQMGKPKSSLVTLFGDEVEGFSRHVLVGEAIQDALPNTDPAVREFVRMTHNPYQEAYCREHMELLFGRTSERIQDLTAHEMQVLEVLGSEFDVRITDNEFYFTLQKELIDLRDRYLEGNCKRKVRCVFLNDAKKEMSEEDEILFSTEHLALITVVC